MNKAWAKSRLTTEDETWGFNRSEKQLEKVWKQNLKLVNPDTKKELLQLENVVKNMLMLAAYLEGYKEGRIN